MRADDFHIGLLSLGVFYNIMKTLINNNRYLNDTIVKQCFVKGQITHVDKQACGNGFTTATFSMSPTQGHTTVVIMPHRAGVIGKHTKYKNTEGEERANNFGTNSVRFFYDGSSDLGFDDADVLVFVADSFLNKAKAGAFDDLKIDKVLLDEYHSIEKDSSYRPNLRKLLSKISQVFSSQRDVAITTVTASPFPLSETNIRIENTLLEPCEIQLRVNLPDVVKEMRELIKKDEEVIIFTNDTRVPYMVLYSKNKKAKETPVNWIVGERFEMSTCELLKFKQDADSKITVCSSTGFEAQDIDYKNANVFFIEDFAKPWQTFSLPNLYQAINRPRAGAKSITYVRLLNDKPLAEIPIDLDRFIERTDMPVEKKMKEEYKEYHPYVFFEPQGMSFSIEKNQVAVNMRTDLLDWACDNTFLVNPIGIMKDWLEDRKITFILPSRSERKKRKLTRIAEDVKIANLKYNQEHIKERDFFGSSYAFDLGYKLAAIKEAETADDKIAIFKNRFLDYLRRKDYDGTYKRSEGDVKVFEWLKSPNEREYFIDKIVSEYASTSIEKHGEKASREHRRAFKKNHLDFVIQLLTRMAKKFVTIKKKEVGNRDYNITTPVNISAVNNVADMMEMYSYEVDIPSCNPRILWGLCGLELPKNFYGENKENKLMINTVLNTLTYSHPEKAKRDKGVVWHKADCPVGFSDFKKNKIKRMKALNFPTQVIEYCVNRYFDAGFTGKFAYDMAYHEKQIVSSAIDIVQRCNIDGYIRRHDSVIILNYKANRPNKGEEFWNIEKLNDVEYFSQKGWFDVSEEGVLYELKYREIDSRLNYFDRN